MAERNCFVILQHRNDSEYNDFIGDYYHFPKKYHKQLTRPNVEFIYYEPAKRGKGVYFGYGRIGKIFEDKQNENNFFAKILDYKPFSSPVPFEDVEGNIRETGPGCNAQNAVRSIEPTALDEICLDGGILLNFKADAHLVQVLGEQLIASERVGILELIKNTIDAGASYCRIRIDNIPSLPQVDGDQLSEFSHLPGPVILIEDDGIGMNRNTIENGWLRPASRLKTNVKDEIRKQKEAALRNDSIGTFNSWLKEYKAANKGRLPLGEKGVGRFATHRLGKFLILKTKVKENDYEYILKINWDDFDKPDPGLVNLESIGVSLSKQQLSRDYGEADSGTQLIIYGGREGFNLTKKNIQEIYDSIQSLNSPFTNPFTKKEKNKTEFRVLFECPQVADELKNETIYDLAPPVFTFDGLVDENGVLEYELHFSPPQNSGIPYSPQTIKSKYDLRISNKDLYSIDEFNFRKPASGPFYIHLDVWYRTSPWIATLNVNKASEFLENFGGIALYRDFVNLFPADWGANTDWLQLSKRHIQKGSNISYYNMYGYVEVFQESNIDLIDKTDRQGLLENKAYTDLAALVRTIVINFVEKEFINRRDDFRNLKKSILREPKENLQKMGHDSSRLIANIVSKYDIVTDPYELLVDFDSNPTISKERLIDLERSLANLEKSIKQIQVIEESLVENAGFGLSAAVAIHELAKITGNFYSGIVKMLKADQMDKVKLMDLKDSASSLKSELKNLSPLRSIRNENKKTFPISRAIEYAAEFYKRTFEKYKISFFFNKNEDFDILERFGTLCQIFSNLIDNSCYWLDTDKENRHRQIVIVLNKENRTIIVADNGPGIDESILPYLYQPGASMKDKPSGLGLYICQYYLNRMKGQIGLTNEKKRLPDMKGAQFTLDFSRVPEN